MAEHGDYWNHNSAYHPWIIRNVGAGRRRILDVGCGEGLLLERLAPLSTEVVGIEKDGRTADRARARTKDLDNVTVHEVSFDDFGAGGLRFDAITFVATIHHMDLGHSLARARSLLAPGGRLLVVGLSANASPTDWLVSGLRIPIVRAASRLHNETRDIGVPIADARESLSEIRGIARRELPGVRIRRALYHRYLLTWTYER